MIAAGSHMLSPHLLLPLHLLLLLPFPPCTPQEMRLVIPNSQRINRGGLVLNELVETCRNHGFSDIVVLHEHRGEPGAAGGGGG